MHMQVYIHLCIIICTYVCGRCVVEPEVELHTLVASTSSYIRPVCQSRGVRSNRMSSSEEVRSLLAPYP